MKELTDALRDLSVAAPAPIEEFLWPEEEGQAEEVMTKDIVAESLRSDEELTGGEESEEEVPFVSHREAIKAVQVLQDYCCRASRVDGAARLDLQRASDQH